MDLLQATANFDRATRHCDNLITVHRGHGGPGVGRRAEEVSLNRAVVVLAVASWQAVIQDYALAAVCAGQDSRRKLRCGATRPCPRRGSREGRTSRPPP